MAGNKTENRKIAIVVGGVILCAMIVRIISNLWFPTAFPGLIRTMLYIALYIGWGISIRRRVIQSQVRSYLSAVSFLMIFWLIVRSCKYYFVTDLNVARYLWYSYYFPMLFIPLLSVYVAMAIGKPEDFRLPKWTKLLYLITALLVLLVLTNDLHQLVFSFPDNEIRTDENNSVELGYFVVLGWEVLCAVTALITILLKNRRSRQKRYLPIIILFCSIGYALIYISGVKWLRVIAGDITAAQCLMFAGILESCLQTGLIPTNTGYDTLFKSVSIGMQITDSDYNARYFSAAARQLPKETMAQAEKGGCLWDETTMLKAYAIRGGHTVWQEDISDLLKVKAELGSTREELEDRNEILRDQYRKDARRYRMEEQNRLYDLVQRETQKQLREIDILSDLFVKAKRGSWERRKLLLHILVLATYIKRHKDMVISSDRSRTVPIHLLEGALRESCSNLSLDGIEGNLYIPRSEVLLPAQTAISAYELFEDALELSLDTLSYYFVTISENAAGVLCLHINLECEVSLADLSEKYADVTVEQDDGGWFIMRTLAVGGDRA